MSNVWRDYINGTGDFELPSFLYKSINDLMKYTLDLGTLLSDDPQKLRAYKEQVKKTFRKKWYDIAEALEYFDIIVPCTCDKEFCEVCNGARYVLNALLSPDEMQEIALYIGAREETEIVDKLQKGLVQALREVYDTDYVSEMPNLR